MNFMDTSPSNGVLSYHPYTKRSGFPTQSPNFGDAHYYYLLLDCESQESHPAFRFVSESGFQSEPSYIDYQDVAYASDLGQNTQFMNLRTTFNQPHEAMVNQSRMHFSMPKDIKDKEHFSYYTWLSQIQQGRCLQTSFEK